MAITVKHKFVSAIPDGADTSVVRPSNWNDDHDFSGTLPVANGGTGVTSSSGANSVVLRDANGNITTNCLFEGFTTQAASSTAIVLVSSSVQNWQITGSGGQTIRLPDATTLPNGATFTFNNNQSSGAITVQNNSSTTVATINSGGYVTVVLLSNSIAAGSWDRHDSTPSNVSWSTNTLDYAGSITSATWNGNTVAYNRGGTGQSSAFVAGGVAYGASTSALGVTSAGTSGQVLTSAGASAPTFSSALTGLNIDNSVIGGTTPAAGTFTTITGQTEVLRTTGNNLFARSQTFNTYWTAGGANITATDNAVTAPDSTTTAANIVPTVTNGLHRISSPSGTLGVFGGVTYTSSIYAKANGYRYLFINNGSGIAASSVFDLQAGTVSTTTGTATITSAGNGWYRCAVTGVAPSTGAPAFYWQINNTYATGDQSFAGDGTSSIYLWGAQLEIGSSATTYAVTTTAGIWNIPSLSFASTATSQIGLQSDGSLYVSPAGTGAIQAQATTSSTVGGNARGANAVDWQTNRSNAIYVASGASSIVGGGYNNVANAQFAVDVGGAYNTASGYASFIGGGYSNQGASGNYSGILGGYGNNAAGYHNFIVGGYSNSGTSGSAVTTQSSTMNGTTAVTLGGSNASIKVGQLVTGTYISNFPNTYVAAVSGTSLTLSQAASGSGTATLSFYTPHGVVVGGGNNQATGSYSFIGGGGDAGTAANRNVASGDWSFVGGGRGNTASGGGSFVGGGGFFTGLNSTFTNTASGTSASVVGGFTNTASGQGSFVGGGYLNTATANYSCVVSGQNNTSNANYSFIGNGYYGTTRSIIGNHVFPACSVPIATSSGVSQAALLILGKQTTDATATVITSDGGAASGINQVILPDNSAYYFQGEIVSGVTGGGNSKGWTISGLIKRGSGVASTTLVGSTVTSLYADVGASTWTIALAADTTNGGLKVTFTGQASTTIRTVCQIRTTEMTY